MNEDLVRELNDIRSAGAKAAGYTSGLCGEWNKERLEELSAYLKVKPDRMVMANQKHTDSILVIGEKEAGYGVVFPHEEKYFDGMITDRRGLMLCIHTADCVPLVFLDPIKRAAGIAHSGWVGTAKCIAAKTVQKMREEYQSRPEDIICCLGPYNHSCCYEVGTDVLEAFRVSFSEKECDLFFKKKQESGKYLLDLGGSISLSLQKEGMRKENIHDENQCTYHTTTFSSWRRTGDRKKQILTYVML